MDGGSSKRGGGGTRKIKKKREHSKGVFQVQVEKWNVQLAAKKMGKGSPLIGGGKGGGGRL